MKYFSLSVLLVVLFAAPTFAQVPVYTESQTNQAMTRWLLLGAIPVAGDSDAARKAGFEGDLLSEAGGEAEIQPQPDASVEIKGKSFQWKLVESQPSSIDLSKQIGDHSYAVAYAYAEVKSKKDAKRTLGIGSDDAVRVWVNGKLVHDNWVGRAVEMDEDLVPVQLRKGKNRILLKIYNMEYGWGFASRFPSSEDLSKRFIRAAARGDQETVEQLLQAGININAKGKQGITAYQVAMMRGYDYLAEFLKSKGATADAPFSPEEFIDNAMADMVLEAGPGACVLVSKGGEILYSKAFGMANLAHEVPVTTKTKFRIGSVTKQFAGAAILKLQEDGKLSVDDPLSKYIPDYPRGDEVTIHHLLTHTSGIPSFTSKADFLDTAASAITTDAMIESFKNDTYDFSPGEKWQYNNSGYFLLGYIIEKVSGMPLAEYWEKNFFEPLGMKDTGIHTNSEVLKHEASGYSYADGNVSKAMNWDMSRAGAAGNIYSTVEDLQRWNEAIFSGDILSKESRQAAWTPVKLKDGKDNSAPAYGYGWMMDEHRGLKRVGHSGGLHGFLSYLARYPDHDLTVVAFHNCSPAVPELTPTYVSELLATAYLWQDMKAKPRFVVDSSVDAEIYDDYVGRYEYGPGAVLTVTRDENRLLAQLSGQPDFEIFPASESKFFWKVVDAQVEFLRDENGKVTAARHTQNGRTFDAPKMKDENVVEVANDILDQYVGKYRYSFFAVLTVRREENQLLAKMTGQSEFEIFPKSENEFFWKVVPAEIKFVKDDEGKVVKAVHQQAGQTIEAKKIK